MTAGQMHAVSSSDGHAIIYYHVRPEDVGGPARRGGLVLLQEIFGVTPHIKSLSDGYAADGYEVIAPSLFDRMEKGFAVGYSPDELTRAKLMAQRVSWDHLVLDLQACTDLLTRKGKVGILGYCFGGSATWVAACRVKGLAAASGYYGRLIIEFVDETPHCPTILHFGERDETIPMEDVNKIIARHPEIPVHVYPSGHGFQSDRPDHYSATCARLARERTLEHFQAHGL